MSDTLFPTPAVPESAQTPLKLAASSATLCRQELHRALSRDIRQWSPESVAEIDRLFNQAEHHAASIRSLLP